MRKCAYFIKNKCCAKIIAKICSKNIGITYKNIQNTQKQLDVYKRQKPTDPLAQEVLRYMADTSKTSVSWNFTSFPSQQFKDDFGAALLEYASGSIDWDTVKTTVVERWAAEKAATAAN